MTEPDERRIRERLRTVRWPDFDTDIVAAGFVGAVRVDGRRVTVEFRPATAREDKVARMECEIRSSLESMEDVEEVTVRRTLPVLHPVLSEGGTMTPLQAEVSEEGLQPDPDPILGPAGRSRWDGRRPDQAGKPADTRYTGPPPVLQWEVDPTDREARSGEAYLTIGDWEYRMWWQLHTRGLAYASIQAIEDDTLEHGTSARPHPVGTAVAVNLVYDLDREAVVAIYGTARDFRPFVEAFRQGFGLSDADSAKPDTERNLE